MNRNSFQQPRRAVGDAVENSFKKSSEGKKSIDSASEQRILESDNHRPLTSLLSQSEIQGLLRSKVLKPVGRRPALKEYLGQIWKRRHFLVYDAQSRIITSNNNLRLGSFWIVGRPLIDAIFYFVIFGVVLQAHNGIDNYPAYIIIGMLMYRTTAAMWTQAAGIVEANRNMIRALSFPRGSIVISLAIKEFMTSVPILALVGILIYAIPPHVQIGWTWILSPFILALQVLFSLGISFLIARVTVGIPDLAFAVTFIIRILMYASSVPFPIERFINHPALFTLMTHNPIFIIIDMYRSVLMRGMVPPVDHWVQLGVWTLGAMVIGFVVFWFSEERYGRV